MLKFFLLLVKSFMMTLTLQATAFFDPQEVPHVRVSDMASTPLPIASLACSVFEWLVADAALGPEWQQYLEEQTEWWRFPLLSAAPQHNTAFTLEISHRPIGRVRQ